MCDYSLHGIPNRLAVEGDELVVHRFRTGTIGLAAVSDLKEHNAPATFWEKVTAIFETPPECKTRCVCVPPGAQLMLRGVPRHLQREWSVEEEAPVTFTQVTAAPLAHRDAIRLANGREILLQHLKEGLAVRVESLGGEAEDHSIWTNLDAQNEIRISRMSPRE